VNTRASSNQVSRVFPVELTERQQWLTWNLSDDGKKIPNGKSNDPKTWVQYSDIQEFEKVAYVFTKDDPFVGIDLDDCIDEHGNYNEVATYCLDLFKGKAYCETSQSGRGLHFIVRGKKPDWSVCSRSGVECYEHGRFWVMTGDVIAQCDTIEDCQIELEAFLKAYLSQREVKGVSAAITVSRKPSGTGLEGRMKCYADACENSSQGGRNNAAFRLAGHLWAMVGDDGQRPSEEMVLEVMRSWSMRCNPPLEEDEVRSIVRNAQHKGTPRDAKLPGVMAIDGAEEGRELTEVLWPSNAESVPRRQQKVWVAKTSKQTDNELATQFVGEHDETLRFVPEWTRWLAWDGTRWAIDHDSNRTLRWARIFTRSLWRQMESVFGSISMTKPEIDNAIRFVKNANSMRGMNAFIDLAAADGRIVIDMKMLNSNPLLLNVPNGTLDLETGQLREHRQSDCITQLAGVSFDAAATCPRWEDALRMIFAGDVEVIRYVQQVLGYSISGLQSEHILPIAYGAGCNGKSMVTNLILKILGDYGYLANDSLLLGVKDAHPTEKAALYQKRFVAISEPGQGSQLKESRVKELTGDGQINARRMHEDFWTFERTHTFWMSTNHLPKIAGNDEGIWRRVKLIPFTVDLRNVTKPIPDFDKLLFEEEGSGILNWLLRGFMDWKQNGFSEPEKVLVAIDDYRQEEDVLTAFIEERCVVGKAWQATSMELYEAYKDFARVKGEVALSTTAFGRQMGHRQFEKRQPTAGAFRRKTLYLGIGLRDDDCDSTLE
jgi:putative DNA primase/helicase